MGKYRSCSEKAVVTFRWEVGFALRFVGPVHHQVPIATKTVSDFICENEENRKKKNRLNVMFYDTVRYVICICRGTLCDETGAVSIFRPVLAAVVATALNRNAGRSALG